MRDVTVAVTTTAAVVTGYCMWARRGSWREPWELGSSITVAGMFGCLLLMAPTRWAQVLSPALHALTGVWNVDDLFGHLSYLIGLTALVFALSSRTNLDGQFLRRRLEAPVAIMLPTLLGLFYVAAPKEHAGDLFKAPATLWLDLYWVVLCGSAGYLLVLLWGLLRVIRRDPRATVTAHIYMVAIIVDGCCLISIVVSRLVSNYPTVITWVLLSVAASGYALAPTYSWRQKARQARAIDPDPALF